MAEVMSFCKAFFQDEKALFHVLRIERRLGRNAAILRGEFRLTDMREIVQMPMGSVLFPGFYDGLRRFLNKKG